MVLFSPGMAKTHPSRARPKPCRILFPHPTVPRVGASILSRHARRDFPMRRPDPRAVLAQIQRLATDSPPDECPDGILLERFAHRREEAAFAALLRRHGPMVLG